MHANTKQSISKTDIEHLWAANTDPKASKQRSKETMHFSGFELYDYGTQIAHKFQNKKGEWLAVISPFTFSVTTAKHLGYVSRAWNGNGKTLYLDVTGRQGERGGTCATDENNNPTPEMFILWADELKTNYAKAAEYLRKQVKRAERKQWTPNLASAAAALGEVKAAAALYAKFFKQKNPLAKVHKPACAARCAALIVEQNARNATRNAEFEAKQAKIQKIQDELDAANAEKIAAWKDGADVYPPFTVAVHLRARAQARENGTLRHVIETSHGVTIPLCAALKLFERCQKVRETGILFDPTAEKLGVAEFSTRSIDKDGNAQVGCHYLTFAEMERCRNTITTIEAE